MSASVRDSQIPDTEQEFVSESVQGLECDEHSKRVYVNTNLHTNSQTHATDTRHRPTVSTHISDTRHTVSTLSVSTQTLTKLQIQVTNLRHTRHVTSTLSVFT